MEFEVGDGTVTTTEDHEFWNVTDQLWQETRHIDAGDLLLTADGATVEAGTLLWETAHVAPAFDLTIDEIHAYHVAAGDESVLVHNNDCDIVDDRSPAELNARAIELLGPRDNVVVLGRLTDTMPLLGTPGRTVLSADDWSPELNDAFVEQLIEEGREVFLASPVQGNLIQEAGPFAGQPTIFARELELLEAAGYRPDGDFLLPPA